MQTENNPAQAPIDGYEWGGPAHTQFHSVLVPVLLRELDALNLPERKVIDVGCGNGAIAGLLSSAGWQVVGVDPSRVGIEVATAAHPEVEFRQMSAYDPLAEVLGQFPLAISLEVAEHVYSPALYSRRLFEALEPGGHLILSTPYHGYWKNLALAVTGRLDAHFTALWEHGHIKFWSPRTITTLLERAGFAVKRVRRVGRVPQLAMTMLVVAQKPR